MLGSGSVVAVGLSLGVALGVEVAETWAVGEVSILTEDDGCVPVGALMPQPIKLMAPARISDSFQRLKISGR